MEKKIYSYIYTIAMWVFGVSLVSLVFVQGALPFGMKAVWSEQGLGSSLVLVRPSTSAHIGQRVAGASATEGQVTLYTVQEVLRREGSLQYRVSDAEVTMNEVRTMSAGELHMSAMVTVPFFGIWVKVLRAPVGVLTLIGLPLFMLLIQTSMMLGTRMIPAYMTLVRSVKVRGKRKNEKKRLQTEMYDSTEDYVEEVGEESSEEREFVTVLKPYNFKRRYGM
jgi:hypothetical protein